MKIFIKSLLCVLFGLMACLFPIKAADLLSPDDSTLGIRALGMANAAVAVADDANAVHDNPAGLGQLKFYDLQLMYNSLYGNKLFSGPFNFYSAVAVPFLKKNTIALSWTVRGFVEDDEFVYAGTPELGYGENFIDLAYGRQLKEKLYLGGSFKLHHLKIRRDGTDAYSRLKPNLDAGILVRPRSWFGIGFVMKNLVSIGNAFKGESYQESRKFSMHLGSSFYPVKGLILALDLNDSVHLGAEYRLMNMVSFRAGISKTFIDKTPLETTAGLGFRYKFGSVDYAFSAIRDLNFSHRLGLAFSWGYSANLVDIIDVEISDMFASQYNNYARSDTVRVMLKNKLNEPLETTVSFYSGKIMKDPVEKKVVLKPKLTTEVRLPVVLDADSVMNVSDDSSRTGVVNVNYLANDRKSVDSSTGKFVLYSRNSFIWDELKKLGAFVTPQDEKIKQFARESIQNIIAGKLRDKPVSDNFYKAMVLYDALGTYGQVYIKDPVSPYGSAGENAVDSVQFPSETLKLKSGDCDDCTMLYCSLLENVGIATMVVTVPGHVLMMLDSGVSPSETVKYFPDGDGYITLGGRVWIPVEATMFAKGFMAAWQEGIDTIKKNSRPGDGDEGIDMMLVQNAWTEYPSAGITAGTWDLKVPDGSKISKFLDSDLDELLVKKSGSSFKSVLARYEEDPDDLENLNVLAVHYARSRIYNRAVGLLDRILAADGSNHTALNTRGNVHMMTREYEKAAAIYRKIISLDSANQKARKNLELAEKLLQGK